jgi:plastocyanin
MAGGCGEKEDVTTGSAAAPAPKTVSVEETEYRITPADPGAAAGTVKFAIRNTGKLTHALEVEGGGGEFKSKPIEAGKSGTLTADLKPGSYEWYCPIGDHKKRGMEGKFTVGKAAGGSGTTPEDKKPEDSGGGGNGSY